MEINDGVETRTEGSERNILSKKSWVVTISARLSIKLEAGRSNVHRHG